MRRQVGRERSDQGAVLGVDRTDPAEMEVVLGHLVEPLARDIPAAGDVLEKGHHIIRTLRTAEGKHQERVVRSGLIVESGSGPTRRAGNCHNATSESRQTWAITSPRFILDQPATGFVHG